MTRATWATPTKSKHLSVRQAFPNWPELGCYILGITLAISVTGCANIATKGGLTDEGKTSENQLVISAVGDIMMGGSARPEMKITGYDFPFERVKDYLLSADITFGNLEGPLTHSYNPYVKKKFIFRSPPDLVAPALAAAGFDVVSLANNHALDHGPTGLVHTMEALEAVGIVYAGAGEDRLSARQPAMLYTKGQKVAFLAYSLTYPKEFWAKNSRAGTVFGHAAYVRDDVEMAKANSDIIIVSFHWGGEGTTKLRAYQVHLGRIAIDAGASVVLGHHPHVLQAIERYRDGVILYSLGNFVFGSYSKKASSSIITQFEFNGSRLQSLRLIPINVNNVDVVFQPHAFQGEEAKKVIDHLKALSLPLGTVIEYKDNTGIIEFKSKDQS